MHMEKKFIWDNLPDCLLDNIYKKIVYTQPKNLLDDTVSYTNTIKYINQKVKIFFKNISINNIKEYDEIILIGSGKGVTSVSKIDELNWKRRKTVCYTKLNKIYNSLLRT